MDKRMNEKQADPLRTSKFQNHKGRGNTNKKVCKMYFSLEERELTEVWEQIQSATLVHPGVCILRNPSSPQVAPHWVVTEYFSVWQHNTSSPLYTYSTGHGPLCLADEQKIAL